MDRGRRKCDVLFLDGIGGVSSWSTAATGAYVGRPKSASSGMNSPMRGPGAAIVRDFGFVVGRRGRDRVGARSRPAGGHRRRLGAIVGVAKVFWVLCSNGE